MTDCHQTNVGSFCYRRQAKTYFYPILLSSHVDSFSGFNKTQTKMGKAEVPDIEHTACWPSVQQSNESADLAVNTHCLSVLGPISPSPTLITTGNFRHTNDFIRMYAYVCMYICIHTHISICNFKFRYMRKYLAVKL